MNKRIIYLAAPYTDPNPAVRRERFIKVTEASAYLISQNLKVVSPLTATHPIDLVMIKNGIILDSDYWVDNDLMYMEMCTEMIILQLEGWEKSSGIKREVKFFQDHNLPISYMSYSDIKWNNRDESL